MKSLGVDTVFCRVVLRLERAQRTYAIENWPNTACSPALLEGSALTWPDLYCDGWSVPPDQAGSVQLCSAAELLMLLVLYTAKHM
jgi:hypothetical protein